MNAYWNKATGSAASARLLFEAGDGNGAANRAYYAMFNAARAFLDVNTELNVLHIRRHSAVLKLFGLHAVKGGFVEARLHSALHEAFEVRAVADYDQTSVNKLDAADLLALMDELLAAIGPHVERGASKP